MLLHYLVKHQYRKTIENLKHASLSQGSVATYLRCGGFISNHFTTDLLLSLPVKQFLKYVNIWQTYRQDGCFTHCVGLGTVLHKDEEFAMDFTYDTKKLVDCCYITNPVDANFRSDKYQSD